MYDVILNRLLSYVKYFSEKHCWSIQSDWFINRASVLIQLGKYRASCWGSLWVWGRWGDRSSESNRGSRSGRVFGFCVNYDFPRENQEFQSFLTGFSEHARIAEAQWLIFSWGLNESPSPTTNPGIILSLAPPVILGISKAKHWLRKQPCLQTNINKALSN